jgi:dephospho-CoA kinase
MMPYTVGLTGGIGSGKSLAAKYFAERGAGIVDTDEIAHRLTALGQPGLEAIVHHFGSAFLLPDGNLFRAKLRVHIFADPAAKAMLESILHPLIRQAVQAEIRGQSGSPYLILVVPLLLETGQYRELVQRVAVVDCAGQLQVSRAMARSGLRQEEVQAIMAAQLPRQQRLDQADDIISNEASPEHLGLRIAELDALYRELAAKPRK